MVAGYKRSTSLDRLKVFLAADLLENNVAALHHLFEMITPDSVCDKRAYAC